MADDEGRDDMELRLRGYFATQHEQLRAPDGLWGAVEPRLAAQERAPWWRLRVAGGGIFGVAPVYAGAAAAVAVLVVGAVMYGSIVGFGGGSDDSATTTASAVMAAPAADAQASELADADAAAMTESASAMESAAMAPAAALAADATALADAPAAAPAARSAESGTTSAPGMPDFDAEVAALLMPLLPPSWDVESVVTHDNYISGELSSGDIVLTYVLGDLATLPASAGYPPDATGRDVQTQHLGDIPVTFMLPPGAETGDVDIIVPLPVALFWLSAEDLTPAQRAQILADFQELGQSIGP